MRHCAVLQLFFAAALGLAACDLFGPDETVYEVRVGTIEFHRDSAVTEIPDTVSAGRPFLLRVRTYGGGCISPGHTEVVVNESVTPEVRLTPFDIEAVDLPRNTVCTSDLQLYDHAALVTLNRVGPATVQIIGWQKPNEKRITVSKQIVVSSESVSRVNAVVLVGKVTDPAGQPVANAGIRITTGTCLPSALLDTVTDGLGNYRKTLLGQRSCTEAQIHLLGVNPPSNKLLSSGVQLSRIRLTPLEAGPSEIRTNFQLRAY